MGKPFKSRTEIPVPKRNSNTNQNDLKAQGEKASKLNSICPIWKAKKFENFA